MPWSPAIANAADESCCKRGHHRHQLRRRLLREAELLHRLADRAVVHHPHQFGVVVGDGAEGAEERGVCPSSIGFEPEPSGCSAPLAPSSIETGYGAIKFDGGGLS